jgi:hypothetical protein
MPTGYVYVLSNPAHPGLLKIGYTTDPVESRAGNLSASTGVLADFRIEYWCLTLAAHEVERLVHRAFAAERVNKRREFFNVDLDAAIEEIEKHVVAPTPKYRRTPSRVNVDGTTTCRRCGHKFVRDPNALYLCPRCGF